MIKINLATTNPPHSHCTVLILMYESHKKILVLNGCSNRIRTAIASSADNPRLFHFTETVLLSLHDHLIYAVGQQHVTCLCLLLIPLTIPFCWSACLSGLEFMALYLLGLDLIFLTGHSA